MVNLEKNLFLIVLKVLRGNHHKEKAGSEAERINIHGPSNSEVCNCKKRMNKSHLP